MRLPFGRIEAIAEKRKAELHSLLAMVRGDAGDGHNGGPEQLPTVCLCERERIWRERERGVSKEGSE